MKELNKNQVESVQGGWEFSLGFVFSGPSGWVALAGIAAGVVVGKLTK